MAERGFAYLYGRPAGSADALPTTVPPESLPRTIAFRSSAVTLADDRWRALSSFSRKVKSGPVRCPSNGNYCGRAYNRVCAAGGKRTPFFEFRWAYFYDAATLESSLWTNTSAASAFSTANAGLVSPTPTTPAKDVDDWQAAADLLVYLARGAKAGEYELPSSMGALAGKLPGYVSGLTPIPQDDPVCDPPVCPH